MPEIPPSERTSQDPPAGTAEADREGRDGFSRPAPAGLVALGAAVGTVRDLGLAGRGLVRHGAVSRRCGPGRGARAAGALRSVAAAPSRLARRRAGSIRRARAVARRCPRSGARRRTSPIEDAQRILVYALAFGLGTVDSATCSAPASISRWCRWRSPACSPGSSPWRMLLDRSTICASSWTGRRLAVPDRLPQRQRRLLPDRLSARRSGLAAGTRPRLAAAGRVARHGDPLHAAWRCPRGRAGGRSLGGGGRARRLPGGRRGSGPARSGGWPSPPFPALVAIPALTDLYSGSSTRAKPRGHRSMQCARPAGRLRWAQRCRCRSGSRSPFAANGGGPCRRHTAQEGKPGGRGGRGGRGGGRPRRFRAHHRRPGRLDPAIGSTSSLTQGSPEGTQGSSRFRRQRGHRTRRPLAGRAGRRRATPRCSGRAAEASSTATCGRRTPSGVASVRGTLTASSWRPLGRAWPSADLHSFSSALGGAVDRCGARVARQAPRQPRLSDAFAIVASAYWLVHASTGLVLPLSRRLLPRSLALLGSACAPAVLEARPSDRGPAALGDRRCFGRARGDASFRPISASATWTPPTTVGRWIASERFRDLDRAETVEPAARRSRCWRGARSLAPRRSRSGDPRPSRRPPRSVPRNGSRTTSWPSSSLARIRLGPATSSSSARERKPLGPRIQELRGAPRTRRRSSSGRRRRGSRRLTRIRRVDAELRSKRLLDVRAAASRDGEMWPLAAALPRAHRRPRARARARRVRGPPPRDLADARDARPSRPGAAVRRGPPRLRLAKPLRLGQDLLRLATEQGLEPRGGEHPSLRFAVGGDAADARSSRSASRRRSSA